VVKKFVPSKKETPPHRSVSNNPVVDKRNTPVRLSAKVRAVSEGPAENPAEIAQTQYN
jgi:hypothetical protein